MDGDACPKSVRAIIGELARKYNCEMIIVASINHNIEGDGRHVIVGNESQAVDFAVINMTEAGDIVVTQDWGLAAIILGRGAGALSPHGRVYRRERIGFLLEERHIKAEFRRTGGRTKGPSPRTRTDDERFGWALERMMQEMSEEE